MTASNRPRQTWIIPRYTTAERVTIPFALGQLVCDFNTGDLYRGDGYTLGGIAIGGGSLSSEAVQDIIGGSVVAGEGVLVQYDDPSGLTTITMEDAVPYDTLVDEASGNLTYVGKALPGSSKASAVWRIFRVDDSLAPDSEIRYADGVSTFNKVWNSRASYTY